MTHSPRALIPVLSIALPVPRAQAQIVWSVINLGTSGMLQGLYVLDNLAIGPVRADYSAGDFVEMFPSTVGRSQFLSTNARI